MKITYNANVPRMAATSTMSTPPPPKEIPPFLFIVGARVAVHYVKEAESRNPKEASDDYHGSIHTRRSYICARLLSDGRTRGKKVNASLYNRQNSI